MSDADADEARGALANVLGALALVVTDEMGRAISHAAAVSVDGRGGSLTDATTLSALAQFLNGATLDRIHLVLGVTPSGAVRLVDRLESAGMVSRASGPDGRSRAVLLTDAGRKRAGAVCSARSEYLAGVVGALSIHEVDALRGLLSRMMAGVVRGKSGGAWTCRLCDLQACRRGQGQCPVLHAALARGDGQQE